MQQSPTLVTGTEEERFPDTSAVFLYTAAGSSPPNCHRLWGSCKYLMATFLLGLCPSGAFSPLTESFSSKCCREARWNEDELRRRSWRHTTPLVNLTWPRISCAWRCGLTVKLYLLTYSHLEHLSELLQIDLQILNRGFLEYVSPLFHF